MEKDQKLHPKKLQIKSVQSIGTQNVYDIEIPETHNFILNNGAVAHNCAHATAYSYLSYLTAYLKCHYPTAFMTAILNSEDPNSDKLQEYKQYAKNLGIEILPPSINKSSLKYEILEDKKIVTGLLAIKGIGEVALEYIISHQPFVSLQHFIKASIGSKGNRSPITKTVIENLAKAGCFDEFGISRKVILERWPDIKIKIASAIKKANEDSPVDLSNILQDLSINIYDEYDKKQLLQYEMEVIGHYLSGTHYDVHGAFFRNGPDISHFSNINDIPSGDKIKIEAIVKNKIKEFKIKNKRSKSFGRAFGKYLLEDINGKNAELTLWPEHYDKYKKFLEDGTAIRAVCEVNEYNDAKSLVLCQIYDIPGVISNSRIILK